jgi:integrase
MRKKDEARVLGPYPESNRWRLVIIERGGRRSIYIPNEEEARKVKAQLERDMARSQVSKELTVDSLITEYSEEKQRLGKALPMTCREQAARLRAFLLPVLSDHIRSVKPAVAERLYLAAVEQHSPKIGKTLAVATHRSFLGYAKHFFGWAAKKQYIAESPFKAVAPVGKPQAGKRQLRIDEARRFIDTALAYYEAKRKPLAIAALMALTMGLRASEVLRRQVRDVDDDGRILWVDRGKTQNARRHLGVPEFLQEHLRQLVYGRRSDDLLFPSEVPGIAKGHQALWRLVRNLCVRAGVAVVCTHSLRGLYATLAVETGALSASVAASLGHGSFAVTEKHYAQPSAVSNARTARVASALAGPRTQPADRVGSMATLLAKLDPAERDQLLALLGDNKDKTTLPS